MIDIQTDPNLLAAVAGGEMSAREPLIARPHIALYLHVARRPGAAAEDVGNDDGSESGLGQGWCS